MFGSLSANTVPVTIFILTNMATARSHGLVDSSKEFGPVSGRLIGPRQSTFASGGGRDQAFAYFS